MVWAMPPQEIQVRLKKAGALPIPACGRNEANNVGICSYGGVCWEVRKPGC